MSGQADRTGPHIENRATISSSMWEVVFALLPATIAAIIFFGPWSLYLVFVSALASGLLEVPMQKSRGGEKEPFLRRLTGDGSAFLAGMLFGLTLPPGAPWWFPFFGALIIFVAKQAFGGIGHNIFNPALLARMIVLLAFPAQSTRWHLPLAYDVLASATPLGGSETGYLQLFFGNVPGSIGETSVLALLIGAGYLFARGFVGWRISLSYLGASFVMAVLLGLDPLFTIFSGSLMFAALFMSTDMVSSPVARTARVVYGIGCGVLTVLIREYTLYPEGVTFAVLIMNGLTPLIDVTVVDSFFGELEKRKKHLQRAVAATSIAIILILIGLAYSATDNFFREYYVSGTVRKDIRDFFPEGAYAGASTDSRNGLKVEEVYSRDNKLGYLVYSEEQGYGGPVKVLVALDRDKRLFGIRIVEEQESAGLGKLVRRPSFLGRFTGLTAAYPEDASEVGIISGATISSRAVSAAVEKALGFDREPESERGPGSQDIRSMSDGVYRGTGTGYQGPVELEVVISRGRIEKIDIIQHRETRRLAESAFPKLIQQVIASQGLDVDTVSGATGSSRGFLSALEDALQ